MKYSVSIIFSPFSVFPLRSATSISMRLYFSILFLSIAILVCSDIPSSVNFDTVPISSSALFVEFSLFSTAIDAVFEVSAITSFRASSVLFMLIMLNSVVTVPSESSSTTSITAMILVLMLFIFIFMFPSKN